VKTPKTVRQELIRRAEAAKLRAYSPYSRFRVGAAILAEDGTIFDGCNVENSSYSLTICAERNAVFQAVHAGKLKFRSIAITSDNHGVLTPCGACRQVLSEFAPKLEIILASSNGTVKTTTLDALFPLPADLKSLARPAKRTKAK
jgi:cytidine deaminase